MITWPATWTRQVSPGSPPTPQTARTTWPRITYQVRVKGPRVEVSRYDGEPDYSAEIEKTFERFRQGAVKDYRVTYRTWPGDEPRRRADLDLVARLFGDEFSRADRLLPRACRVRGPGDPPVRPRAAVLPGLPGLHQAAAVGRARLLLPGSPPRSKEIFARDTFDLALAAKLTAGGSRSSPTSSTWQGRNASSSSPGRTRAARPRSPGPSASCTTWLAPAARSPAAQPALYLYDQIFTHFEREEDLAELTRQAGRRPAPDPESAAGRPPPDSIVIMNEIFTSTTVADALFLGEKVLAKVIELDLLCVYVTFIDELASAGPHRGQHGQHDRARRTRPSVPTRWCASRPTASLTRRPSPASTGHLRAAQERLGS